VVADVFERAGADGRVLAQGGGDQVVGEDVLHQLQRLVEEELGVDAGVLALDLVVAAGEDGRGRGCGDLEQAGLDAVVEVGGEVGDLVGEVDDLGFERRAAAEEVGRARGAGRRCSRGSA
jgi:hypothetical protein